MSTPAVCALLEIFDDVNLIWPHQLQNCFLTDIGQANFFGLPASLQNNDLAQENAFLSSLPRAVDVFINLQPWTSAGVQTIQSAIGAATSVGLYGLFDLRPETVGIHYADRIFSLVSVLRDGLEIDDFATRPIAMSYGVNGGPSLLATLPAGARLLAWHGDTKHEKQWGFDKFADTVLTFLETHEDYYAIGVGYDNLEVRSRVRHKRLIGLDNMTMQFNLKLLSECDLFLGIDSCMLHAADLLRIPGVGIFGPCPDGVGGSDEFGFRFARHRHLSGDGQIEKVGVDDVLSALEQLCVTSE